MEPKAARLTWPLVAATATLVVAGLTLLLLTLDQPPQGGWGFRGFTLVFVAGAGPLGWLIMVRRPDNPIGLLLALVALLGAAQLFLTEYAAAGTRTSLPASNVAALVNAFVWVPSVALMAGAIPLVFPDGHLLSPRWRWIAAILVGCTVALCLLIAAYPDALGTPRVVRRDFRVPFSDASLNAAAYVVVAVMGATFVAAAVSLFLRWRRSSGVIREQLKWLALSVTLVVATMWLSLLPGLVFAAIFISAVGSVPIAVGIAVLRYRLYEIDAVISRTLVFGLLTALLTGAFAGLQKLFQTVFVSATGNESDAALVITTLVLAAGFAPLKRVVERVVERRFAAREGASGHGPTSRAAASALEHGTGDLEVVLRRVIREEIRAALASADSDADNGASAAPVTVLEAPGID